MEKIAIVSLGCSKNMVDSEVMQGYLTEAGYSFTVDPSEADVIIINTCGFIEDAKVEAVDNIFAMAEYKKDKCKALLVTGCFSQRYPKEISEIPEVDGVLGTYAYQDIAKAVREVLDKKRCVYTSGNPSYLDNAPRCVSTSGYAYIKIAEGCDNKCAYCAIPSIRGPYVSRSVESVLREAESLKKSGFEEIILIAQDTTRYGSDRGEQEFADLLEKVAKIGFTWVRIMYAYPSTFTPEVISVMEKYDNICKYVDIPIQHTEDKMLQLMNRHYTQSDLKAILERLRSSEYDWAIRTTLLCGFPGETDRDYKKMLEFIKEYKFDNLGVFPFSLEEGTPAEDLPNKCYKSTGQKRADGVMLVQGSLSHQLNKRREGKVYKTLVEGFDTEANMFFGRTYFLAPEVDGAVYFSGEDVEIGKFYDVLIEEAFGYDFFGRKI